MKTKPTKTDSNIPVCPECGEMARGTLERVEGVALVYEDPTTGEVPYDGDTQIDWNSQQTVERDGKPVWVCRGCGQDWTAEVRPA